MTPTPDEITGKSYAPAKVPVCPYCGQDPARISGVTTKMGVGLFIVIFCENDACRKIHGVVQVQEASVAVQAVQVPGVYLPRTR